MVPLHYDKAQGPIGWQGKMIDDRTTYVQVIK